MKHKMFTKQDQVDKEDELCFKYIFEDNLIFGAILTTVFVIFLILFVLLIMYWNKRKFWFPMQERSTYCTLAFLIACSINFSLQPILLIIYSLNDSVYMCNGLLELMFKFFYIFTRFCLTTIYIAKVSRLTFAFQVKEINRVYHFFQSELLVLTTAIFTAFVVALTLILNESDNIVLSIEDGYAQNVQDFWVPLQSIEAIVCSTLLLMMQNIAPYYKLGKEIVTIFLSNLFFSIVQYSLYYNDNSPSFCHPIDYRTYIVFWFTQIKTLVKIIFCVYYPLQKASDKQIPLPNERELINTVDGNDSLQQFYLILSFYNEDIEEPFINYLKYLDKNIQLQTFEGLNFQSRINNLSQKYPMINQIKSFSTLYQCYVELSLALELEDEALMEKVVHQYIIKDIQQNNNIGIQDLTQKQQYLTSIYQNNNANANNVIDQSTKIQNQRYSDQNISSWRKYLCCFSNGNNKIQRGDILTLDENTKTKIIESFLNQDSEKRQIDNTEALNQKESKINALADVKNELFQYIHILWKEFFSRTKSFCYLREIFMRYGSTRNHLQKFKLSNLQYFNS